MSAPVPIFLFRQPVAVRCMAASVALGNEAKDWSAEIAAVAASRDRECFMRIYDHFMPRLCLYLRGIGAAEAVAEDLGQEALLRLWQRAGSYDAGRSALSTWLFRIARNLHIDRLRRERGHLRADVDAVDLQSEPDSCPAEPSAAEAFADHVQLQRRIDALSPVQARLIRMSYFEARSHQDIALELGMPLGTVKSHLRRAFLRLQGQMVDAP